mmetsp:Transcript_35621/g.76886  ORF Transcript_35621/g.76886 Transcript_35621/m.76886 type:complete len:168 (+) Transcript_35621:450-953(+)
MLHRTNQTNRRNKSRLQIKKRSPCQLRNRNLRPKRSRNNRQNETRHPRKKRSPLRLKTTEPIPPAKQIILLGERHSGTNWITDHLADCFEQDIDVTNQYARFKHWFQDGELSAMPDDSAVVVVMFRDPYDWVEAMRVEPHHTHDHVHYRDDYDHYDATMDHHDDHRK